MSSFHVPEQLVYRKAVFVDSTFQISVSSVATIVQFLGMMPVCGISNTDPTALKFKWGSFRVVLTLFYILYGIIVSSTMFTFISAEGISAKNIGIVNNHHQLKHNLMRFSWFRLLFIHDNLRGCILSNRKKLAFTDESVGGKGKTIFTLSLQNLRI